MYVRLFTVHDIQSYSEPKIAIQEYVVLNLCISGNMYITVTDVLGALEVKL